MNQTYRDASSVLVLDRELQRLDTAMVSPLEQDLLTAFVAWTRRLWTLQEAAFANRLYIQTLRGPHILDTSQTPLTAHDRLLSQLTFRNDLATFMRARLPSSTMLARAVLEPLTPTSSAPLPASTTTVLERLALAVQHRSTSVPADEPVVLALALGLPVATVLAAGADRDARMAALLTLVRDVPADVVFAGAWPGERCARAGVRWAPRTLLGVLLLVPSASPPAVCDERGLHASYRGLVVDASLEKREVRERCYAVDELSGMKYEFRAQAGSEGRVLPEKTVLLFRDSGGDVAVASVVGRDGQDEVELLVVGHWNMIASAAVLKFAEGVPVVQAKLTNGHQRWCIT